MRPNITQIRTLKQLINHHDGIVKTSEWTNGMGRHTTRKAVPPFCERICRVRADEYTKKIQKFFADNPRVQEVVAVTNYRAVNKLFKEEATK